jgi:hypothetical protein
MKRPNVALSQPMISVSLNANTEANDNLQYSITHLMEELPKKSRELEAPS